MKRCGGEGDEGSGGVGVLGSHAVFGEMLVEDVLSWRQEKPHSAEFTSTHVWDWQVY